MGEVIDFKARQKKPKDKEVADLLQKIDLLQDALKDIYYHVDDAYRSLNMMEEECGKVEKVYDQTILELSRRIGSENIPVEFLHYSRNVKPQVQEDGSIHLIWEPEEDIEITFTPDED